MLAHAANANVVLVVLLQYSGIVLHWTDTSDGNSVFGNKKLKYKIHSDEENGGGAGFYHRNGQNTAF